MSDLAGPDDLVGNRLGQIRWDGEPDAVAVGGDGGIDADDVAARVEQRAAAVAGVGRGVELQKFEVALAQPFCSCKRKAGG